MTVQADDPRSPSVQIADDLRAKIESGELPPGKRLPSGRELARSYGVALMTAQNALQRLRDEGFLHSSSRGYFVGEKPETAGDSALRLQALEKEVRDLQARVEHLENR